MFARQWFTPPPPDAMSAPRLRVGLAICFTLALFCLTVAQAQNTNPTPDVCGLPKSGEIFTTVTYTLSSNCTQTGELRGDASLPANAKIVIDGKGYTVDATALNNSKPFFYCVGGNANVQLEIKDLTIKGGGASSSGALYFWRCNVKLTRVTLTDSFRQAIWAYADNPNYSYTYELTNMLVEMPNGAYRYNFLHSPGALAFSGNTTVEIRDIVLRDMVGVAAAVVNSHSYSGNTSITFSGCLSVERVYAQFSHGAITNDSSGKCTGAIGNGGNADSPNPAPPVSDCGLPLQGTLAVIRHLQLDRRLPADRSALYPQRLDRQYPGQRLHHQVRQWQTRHPYRWQHDHYRRRL